MSKDANGSLSRKPRYTFQNMSISERPPAAPSVRYAYIAMLLLTFLKIFWVSDREIMAVGSDQLTYATAANAFYWAQDYDLENYIRLPGMPLLLWAVKQTGFPWRLAIEGFYLAACWVFARGCLLWSGKQTVRIVGFGLTAFWPPTLPIFDQLFSEALASVFVVAATGYWMTALAVTSGGSRIWFKYGLCMGSWIITRDEVPLMASSFVAHLIGTAVAKGYVYPRHWAPFARNIAVPAVLGLLLPWFLVCSINWFRIGYFYTHDMALPGYKAAYRGLLSITPAETPPRHIPLVKSVREQAYQASPTFATLREVFEDPGAFGRQFTESEYPGSDEIATGWMYWTLRGAVARQLGTSYTAREADAYFNRIGVEIRQAAAEGTIETRRVLHPFLDPNYDVWLHHLPASIGAVARVFLMPEVPREWVESTDPVVRRETDRAANRRSSLSPQPLGSRVSYSGWIVPIEGKPLSVLLREEGVVIASFGPLIPRPDVQAHFASSHDPGVRLGFAFGEVLLTGSLPAVLQVETLVEGRSPLLANLTIDASGKAHLEATPPSSAFYATDYFSIEVATQERPLTQSRLLTGGITVLAALAAVVSLVLCLVRRTSLPLWSLMIWVGFGVATARVCFYGLLDASSWNGQQARYLFPGQAAFFGTLAAALVAGALTIRWPGRKRAAAETGAPAD